MIVKKRGKINANDMLNLLEGKEPLFVCIGTPKCMGDAIGPIIGHELKLLGYKVYGTLDNPVMALNMKESIDYIMSKEDLSKYTVVAIDACITDNKKKLGYIKYGKGFVKPGAGVGLNLPPVGDICIKCFCCFSEGTLLDTYYKMANTSIEDIMPMVKKIKKVFEEIKDKR